MILRQVRNILYLRDIWTVFSFALPVFGEALRRLKKIHIELNSFDFL